MIAYFKNFRRCDRPVSVHIVRTTAKQPQYARWPRDYPQAWCGVAAREALNSPRVDVDPLQPLAEGLAWCGPCVGRAAEYAGVLPAVVELLMNTATKESA